MRGSSTSCDSGSETFKDVMLIDDSSDDDEVFWAWSARATDIN